jgi:hypothetical protein
MTWMQFTLTGGILNHSAACGAIDAANGPRLNTSFVVLERKTAAENTYSEVTLTPQCNPGASSGSVMEGSICILTS